MLSLVGVPIGNSQDITLRALDVLKECDLLLCEDRKTASRYFRSWNIPFPSDRYLLLNEHTTDSELSEIFSLIKEGKNAVLISDAGMPLLCDPGETLVRMIRKAALPMQVIPGVTALTTAIAYAGVGGHGFTFLGYPPRETEKRIRFFQQLSDQKGTQIFYETPYRLKKVLQELSKCLPHTKRVFVGAGLTTDAQKVVDCSVKELSTLMNTFPKLPPVFIVYDDAAR